jgi:hypothetical protein
MDIHTMNPFEIPSWYTIVESIDHGHRNPTAVLWVAYATIEGFDYAFVVDEHYEKGQLVGHHAQKILSKREDWGYPLYTIIDASAAQQDPNTGRSVIDEYIDHGIMPIPSDRHVAARINRVGDWLRLDPKVPHPITGEFRTEGWPRLFIFKNNPHLIEHVGQYQWAKKRPTQEADAKEKPLEKDDHDVDSLGYNLMSRPIPGMSPVNHEDKPYEWYWNRVRERMDNPSKSSHTLLGSEA